MKRFWDRVDKSGNCWEWEGGERAVGYGGFRHNGEMFYAHRFAYSITRGPIPDGMCVCHHCDNKKCVNPSHLFIGTLGDNNRDAVAKGRARQPDSQGILNGRSKLREDDVREIRRLYPLGIDQVTLAKMWRISNQQVSNIVLKRQWIHI